MTHTTTPPDPTRTATYSPMTTPAPADRPGRLRRARALVVPVGLPLLLVVVLLALLATSGWFWIESRQRGPGRGAAATTARTAAITFFSLDYRHPRANIDQLLAMTAGQFRSEYAAQRAKLQQQVVAKKLTVRASVPADGTATEFFSSRRAQVLVAVDTTTSLPNGHSEKSAYRTRVVLTRHGERWLVSGLEQVG